MKNIFIVLTLVWFGFISNAFSADFKKGLDAYDKGDYVTALNEWRPLAEQGDAATQFYLGFIYGKGEGVVQDYQEAVKWYRLAAEQGHATAQYNLGGMYAKGNGVVQDYKEADRLWRLAANKKVIGSYTNLGRIYLTGGHGIIQNYYESFKWYGIGAAQGSAPSQYGLGYMYANGFGVIKDYVLAHMWFNIAVSQGNDQAQSGLDNLLKLMTATQIEEAQRLARECQRKEYKGCWTPY